MARFWPIYVLFLVTFLVWTVDSATTVNREASPKKTFLEKLNKFVSLVARSYYTLYENFGLIGALLNDKLNSSVRAIEPLERLRKPVVTMPLPEFTTSPPVVTTPAFVKWKMAACGDRWTKYGNSYFSFCLCTRWCSVNSARTKCKGKQAKLAKCSSREMENFFVRSLAPASFILLGANDRDKEETWRWPDGSLVNKSYTNWGRAQPVKGTERNCLMFMVPANLWRSWGCDFPYSPYSAGWVCEKKRP